MRHSSRATTRGKSQILTSMLQGGCNYKKRATLKFLRAPRAAQYSFSYWVQVFLISERAARASVQFFLCGCASRSNPQYCLFLIKKNTVPWPVQIFLIAALRAPVQIFLVSKIFLNWHISSTLFYLTSAQPLRPFCCFLCRRNSRFFG